MVIIIASNSGRFLICVPRVLNMHVSERLGTVGRAVVRIAELLGADIEVSQRRNLLSVWVYYRECRNNWSSVYFDWGKDWSEREVFSSIRSEVYRLSPHHSSFVSQSARIR